MARVTPGEIIERGFLLKCPNCGGSHMFDGIFRLREKCPDCGMDLVRSEGCFLGAVTLNYGITVFFALPPVAILWWIGALPDMVAIVMALATAIFFPAIFYRHSRSLWLTIYFLLLPYELPANEAHSGEQKRNTNV